MSTNQSPLNAIFNTVGGNDASRPTAVTSASREAGRIASIAAEARSVAVASAAVDPSEDRELVGIKNRLFLKYARIDYEFFNFYDMQFRSTAL